MPIWPDWRKAGRNQRSGLALWIARRVEFFRWTVVSDLAAALAVVEAAERPQLGILADMLHFNRSDSRLEQIDQISAARVPFVHVCDGPVQDSYTTEELLRCMQVARNDC